MGVGLDVAEGRLFAGIGNGQNEAKSKEAGQEIAAAMADKRQRDAGQWQEFGHAGNVEKGLSGDGGGEA